MSGGHRLKRTLMFAFHALQPRSSLCWVVPNFRSILVNLRRASLPASAWQQRDALAATIWCNLELTIIAKLAIHPGQMLRPADGLGAQAAEISG